MDHEDQTAPLLAPSPEFLATVSVFPLIPAIKKDVVVTIDSALTFDQLRASDINFAIVRPLVLKYAKLKNMSVVYACLVNRAYFLEESEDDLAYAGIMLSRATLCEILAMKLLSHFASNHITLVAVLTTSWSPLAGASPEVIEQVKQVLGTNANVNDAQSALEMAISTHAKEFISSPISQKVITDIYTGRIVFSTATTRSMLADNYKPKAITIYDCREAPFLDHYRLRVPKYGAILEFLNFACLLFTFVLCLSNQDLEKLTFWEVEYTASTEHGWIIYIANMWNVFDTSFVLVFLCFIAFDLLACGACILFPRLAFFAVSNNVIFVFFMAMAAICFSGLLFTLWTLGKASWTLKRIAWLMVQIWFGNTYLSFAQAEILMTTFAALSNTVRIPLAALLISILSNTVARIDAADALFSYQPPFNLLALALLKPASWIVSPRTLHSLNVFLIKITSFPILIAIGIYERYFADGQILRESSRDAAHTIFNSLPRQIKNIPLLRPSWARQFPQLRSIASRETMTSTPADVRRRPSRVSLAARSPHRGERSPLRPLSGLDVGVSSAEVSTAGRSPLSKFFAHVDPPPGSGNIEASVRRVETMLDEMRELPVHRLKDEMRELQERQARIEQLLLTLTRGMRASDNTSSSRVK
ncbi:hypothetical protein B0H17DRAFT_1034111 [Mycena rosella]|uniref:YVC1 N-terminal linker helical domain-containing protein n=1 Tax=Mycena rosella TaxID=1033263 RepID=A0AAD7MA73_MYCRO|nr:hypothetical protein B0H17DRAFT_1034111 [Mycena rosella]